MANPDRRENYQVHKEGPRRPAINITGTLPFLLPAHLTSPHLLFISPPLPSPTSPQPPQTEPPSGFDEEDYYVNYVDAVTGFIINGTLPVDANQGVHSLTDVPVFAQGPCQELFGGVYNNIDIFYNIAECLGLGRDSAPREE